MWTDREYVQPYSSKDATCAALGAQCSRDADEEGIVKSKGNITRLDDIASFFYPLHRLGGMPVSFLKVLLK